MSDVDNAVEGAEAALPDETPKTVEVEEQGTEVQQESATAENDANKDDQPRDEGGRFQKRVNELTRKQWDARREAEAARREAEELRAELNRYRQPQAPDPNQDPWGAVQHLAREEARAILESERGQWAQQQEHQRLSELGRQHEAREQAFSVQHPDYQEAADAFVSMAGHNVPLAEVLMSSEHGPAVVHYLGTHLDEAAQVVQLPPHLAALAVARIEARVAAPKPTAPTKAPNPPPTLGGSAVVSKDPARMSYADYKAWREGRK